ncbi:alpha-hydroxy acid oxidase [Pontivivens ytuae]|uniref:Alpha-hydroxy-acid oxidizing protein n=1 Tax=Pontivivens ytuae TaxID=2789856 RepID=A0A7S9QB16_9RHOB|nr:alpha-hydroxy acid oxidase [Pontivivens ytuae]QPH52683.1 alpha-hydroxy-acid oxidizing protein [Pontivivens ytuae]
MQNLDDRFPAISDLAAAAKCRIPHFAWEYLDSGTTDDVAMRANRTALDAVRLVPRFLKGDQSPDLTCTLFGQEYGAPIGMAPVGLTGLMWPGAEAMLADTARRGRIPYCLSTVAAMTPEEVGPAAGDYGWFQLYPPRDPELRRDVLARAWESGMKVLALTVDIPAPSRRERQRRAGLSIQAGVSRQMLSHIAVRPRWALATARNGKATLATIVKYAGTTDLEGLRRFFTERFIHNPDLSYVEALRQDWPGALVVKGILSAEDALEVVERGADGVWVSNHGGRQFDAAPPAIEALPRVVEALAGRAPVIFDSGIRTGLDIARALALGADFCFAGRPFLYGVAAAGQAGADQALHILRDDLDNAMRQFGAETLAELRRPGGIAP